MKRILLLSFMSLAVVFGTMAQRTVSGKITSAEDGSGIPGVNVVLKGTTTGTTSDLDGNYRISVPEDGGTLVFSFVGLQTQEVSIGTRSTIDVGMSSDVQQLTEVVVTAMNISRDKASLGYATQTLDSDAVTQAKEQNFVNSLSGKVAGVQIRTNNNFGGSTNIVIRGNNSISGTNQPLFVVDGVPIDNRTGNDDYQQRGRYGYDYGNAASDINPESIESISVLKGAAATALYGSRAANGAVIITTKKGKSGQGIGVSVSSGLIIGKINKKTFVKYQDQYGAGYSNYYYGNDGGPFDDYYDNNGDGTIDQADWTVPTYEDASYGQKFDPTLNVWHWDSFVPESPNFGKPYAWSAAESTPVDFFETSLTWNNSVSISGGSENNTFRLGYTNFNQTGILPNSDLLRHTINFSGVSKINPKLTATVNANISAQDVTGRNSTGYGDNLMSEFRQWWETNVSIKDQKDLFFETGRNVTWNMYDAAGGDFDPIFWDNPYWTRHKNYQTDKRNRTFGNVSLDFNPIDWLNITGRVSLDHYTELREQRRAVGSVPQEFGIQKLDEQSGYHREDREVTEANYDFLVSVNRKLSSDLSLYALVGSNIRVQNFESVWQSTSGGLAIPDLYTINNSKNKLPLPVETIQEKEVYGFFGNVNLGYNDMLYLDLTGRRDISSALPVGNNAYNYGSAALSFIFSEVVDLPWLNFGKARLNYAEVGNDTDPLNTKDYYLRNDNFDKAVIYTASSYRRNPELEPERQKSLEFGLEGSVLNNRLRFDVAAYNTNTFNQIMTIEVSRATGYRYKTVNGGEINNHGLELTLSGTPVKVGDFSWDATVNWTAYRSEVKSLAQGIENFVIQSYQGGVSLNATVGEPFGVLRGTGFEYLDGEKVVTSSGYYAAVPDQVIGNPNPDWMMGITNSLSYKGLNLSFLIDWSQGGDVYSLDMHYGQGTGVTANTVGTNDLGNDWRLPVADGGGIKLEGVQADGTPNEVYGRADYYGGVFYWGNSARNPAALTVYDATYIKLRELALSYSLPSDLIGGFAKNINLSVVGRNLWIIKKYLPYADPESGLGAGNAQGYVSGSYPTTRTVGFKVDFNF
ncbi:SusC/RagA family TonB-linked outer membrane protein [Marinoscillum sp. MHG1-6]|uniref:SusC/RagA family TonB-linked outer membrane protein n=1 Tax=Marinoscillum sp. MHG1-6 TaxID=2959627 RepID=UPI00215807BE|nr:SusC/RagA family TonB-linked outer membrane protein [Marinoscillum sp. MHG1-6]